MSARTVLLNRVVVARRRLRDTAAAAAAVAATAEQAAQAVQAEAEAQIAAQEASATARYMAARGGQDFLTYAQENQLHREVFKAAAERVAVARSASDVARGKLSARARDLEVMERKAREAKAVDAEKEAKAEQSVLDELGSSRVAAMGGSR